MGRQAAAATATARGGGGGADLTGFRSHADRVVGRDGEGVRGRGGQAGHGVAGASHVRGLAAVLVYVIAGNRARWSRPGQRHRRRGSAGDGQAGGRRRRRAAARGGGGGADLTGLGGRAHRGVGRAGEGVRGRGGQ